MFFKNLTVMKLDAPLTHSPGELEELLQNHRLVDPGLTISTSLGWVLNVDGQLVMNRENQMLLTLGRRDRILPGAVVKKLSEERRAELEQKQGFAPGSKQKRSIKEAVILELLPKAFIRESSVRGLIDVQRGLILVDTPSANKAEDFVHHLRSALTTLPTSYLITENSPGHEMTQWLSAGEMPGDFTIDQECILASQGANKKSLVRYEQHELNNDTIQQHIKEGKRVQSMGVTWSDSISFTLTDGMVVKKMRILDIKPSDGDTQPENEDLQMEANFALMAGMYGKMVDELTQAFGGPQQQKAPPAATAAPAEG